MYVRNSVSVRESMYWSACVSARVSASVCVQDCVYVCVCVCVNIRVCTVKVSVFKSFCCKGAYVCEVVGVRVGAWQIVKPLR